MGNAKGYTAYNQEIIVKKKMPKWLKPAIALAIVALLIAGVVVYAVMASGGAERSRVVVKSETGKYDVTEAMASYMLYTSYYYQNYYYYLYTQYGLYTDTYGITDTYSSAGQFAANVTASYTIDNLRSTIESNEDMLKEYVAVCDKAYADADFRKYADFTEEEESELTQGWEWMEELS